MRRSFLRFSAIFVGRSAGLPCTVQRVTAVEATYLRWEGDEMRKGWRMACRSLLTVGFAIGWIGAVNAKGGAPPMPPSGDIKRDEAIVDKLTVDAYRRCWAIEKLTHANLNLPTSYVPRLKVERDADGVLVGRPVVVNPRQDEPSKALAEAALHAVERCRVIPMPNNLRYLAATWRVRSIVLDP